MISPFSMLKGVKKTILGAALRSGITGSDSSFFDSLTALARSVVFALAPVLADLVPDFVLLQLLKKIRSAMKEIKKRKSLYFFAQVILQKPHQQ